ncbi:hypothetical protein CC85DRAFT_282819 [Cutaneotrichosporon oleaginosum]|uniref:Uncharacterized protein n=1 Tax=Cutaneotrichosporon oleaginosum TaxID=879819 RepID=A0A0J1BBG5_9TREE|nr:uncharacterized protein CC85DRAFT_282819 [Cutaneotrichosporon oleaginosum]KLT45334.1 hypothetical protein CC85DRAFT_282819 [Cutaneotrichosporon oleaginosum]TXT14837.1 hypothetical protein COLE_01030 [Cutaneotrichosporon oleaginosum]
MTMCLRSQPPGDQANHSQAISDSPQLTSHSPQPCMHLHVIIDPLHPSRHHAAPATPLRQPSLYWP